WLRRPVRGHPRAAGFAGNTSDLRWKHFRLYTSYARFSEQTRKHEEENHDPTFVRPSCFRVLVAAFGTSAVIEQRRQHEQCGHHERFEYSLSCVLRLFVSACPAL